MGELCRVAGEVAVLLCNRNPTFCIPFTVIQTCVSPKKTLNLDKDFEEIMSKMQHAWWNESTKATGDRMKMKISNLQSFVLKVA